MFIDASGVNPSSLRRSDMFIRGFHNSQLADKTQLVSVTLLQRPQRNNMSLLWS
jgi:hypothetical protein